MLAPRNTPTRSRARTTRTGLAALAGLLAACALALGACGDTLQDRPIAHNMLESLIVAPYPVYWLGRSFQGLQITDASHDPGGAFCVQYGDCVVGGQSTCVTPVSVVTSPDNSFVPGGSTSRSTAVLRGVQAVLAEHGRTVAIATGGVVVNVYADSARLARRPRGRSCRSTTSANPARRCPRGCPTPASARRRYPRRCPRRCARCAEESPRGRAWGLSGWARPRPPAAAARRSSSA